MKMTSSMAVTAIGASYIHESNSDVEYHMGAVKMAKNPISSSKMSHYNREIESSVCESEPLNGFNSLT